MTEGLAHELRQRGENVTAHLFVYVQQVFMDQNPIIVSMR